MCADTDRKTGKPAQIVKQLRTTVTVMCPYLCIYIYRCRYRYIHTHTHTHTGIYMYIYIYIYIYTYIYKDNCDGTYVSSYIYYIYTVKPVYIYYIYTVKPVRTTVTAIIKQNTTTYSNSTKVNSIGRRSTIVATNPEKITTAT